MANYELIARRQYVHVFNLDLKFMPHSGDCGSLDGAGCNCGIDMMLTGIQLYEDYLDRMVEGEPCL